MYPSRPRLRILAPSVRCVDDSTVLKRGTISSISREVEAMSFVSENTDIPIPQILDQGTDVSGLGYFTMKLVPGEHISAAWHRIDEEQRSSIVADLKTYLDQLRSLEQPNPGWIGSCSHGPVFDQRINNGEPFGPLNDERAFNDLLLGGLEKHAPERAKFYRSSLTEDHKIVFTHGDLSGDNILVADGRVTAILDWQTAGWMPEYWEYRKSRYGKNSESWWVEMIHAIMDHYEREWQVDSDLEWC